MAEQNWKSFTKKINVKAPIEKLYWAWTTQEGLESWFLRNAPNNRPDGTTRSPGEHFQAGDIFHWTWYGYPDSVFERREVLEANGKDKIRFMFTDTCDVTVKFKPTHKADVIVELTQDNIPPDEESRMNFFVGCGEGWTFYLANLKSVMEGGIDLRNKDEDLQGLINA